MIRFLLSMIAILVMGFAVISLFFKKHFQQKNRLECLSLSFLLGMGCVVAFLFLLFILKVPFRIEILFLGPLIALIIINRSWHEILFFKMGDMKALFYSWTWWEKCLMLGILIQVLRSFIYAIPVPVNSYDALASYALKAKIFSSAQGIPNGFFHWGEETITHPDYPLLVPFILTWVCEFAGFNDVLIMWFMPIIFLVFALLVGSQLARRFNRQVAFVGVFVLSSLPQLFYYATIIHADLILACYVTAGGFYLLRYVEEGKRALLIISSIMFGLSVWTKSEGMIWVAAFIISHLMILVKADNKSKTFKDVACSIAVLVLLAGPWVILKSCEHMVNCDVDLSLLSFTKWWESLRHIGFAFYQFQKEVFNVKKWNIFWVLGFMLLIFNGIRKNNHVVRFFVYFLLIVISGYLLGYTLFTGYPMEHYVTQTMSRFLIHLAGPFLVLTIFACILE